MPRQTAWMLPLLGLAVGLLLLVYEHYSGGVRSHHLLNRSDFPEVSNWWALLSLPGLGGLALLRARSFAVEEKAGSDIWRALIAAALYGVALSCAFEFGFTLGTEVLFFALFVIALV